jgi:ELWxxDGT repeat protein
MADHQALTHSPKPKNAATVVSRCNRFVILAITLGCLTVNSADAEEPAVKATASERKAYATNEPKPGPRERFQIGAALIDPEAGVTEPRLPVVFQGKLYFIAEDTTHGRELFSYDGSAVKLVADINPGPASSYPSEFFVWKDKELLLFRADDGVHGKELFAFDGRKMWMIDDLWQGTSYNPYAKKTEPSNGNPSELFEDHGKIFFCGKTKDHPRIGDVGAELFYFDGTLIQLVRDFNPGPADSHSGYFTPLNGGFIFAAAQERTGRELFWVDKLLGGNEPRLIADIYPGTSSSNPAWLTRFKDQVYFLAEDGRHGRELHRSDGLTEELVADINPGPASSFASDFVVYRDELVFRADDGKHGSELFRCDGKTVELISDIRLGAEGSEPSQFFEHDGILYFAANGGPPCGRELYSYDGHSVKLALDINPGPSDGTSPDCDVHKGHRGNCSGIPSDFVVFRGELYFVADDGQHGRQWMKFTCPIWKIQGSGFCSMFEDRKVTTEGIVTAVSFNQLWIQDATGDGDDNTSDALAVETGIPPIVTVGDHVVVSGRVVNKPRLAGELADNRIIEPQISRLSSGNSLPPAIRIGGGGRLPPTQIAASAMPRNGSRKYEFDPQKHGLDFWKSLESMRVQLIQPVAVSGTNRFHESFVVVDQGKTATGMSARGNLNLTQDDLQPEVVPVHVDPYVLRNFPVPKMNTRDHSTEITGIVRYNFGRYEIVPTEAFSVEPGGIEPMVSTLVPSDEAITVATYNVFLLDPKAEDRSKVPPGQKYDDVDDDVGNGRYAALARQIVKCLRSPDIIGLQELQDSDGCELTENTDATETLRVLVDAIEHEGGPKYSFIASPGIVPAYKDPQTGELISPTGNIPGNNLQVGFIYNPRRVQLVEGSARLLTDPKRQAVDRTNPFWRCCIPLSATFRFNNQEVTVVANHWAPKENAIWRFGAFQPWQEFQNDSRVNAGLDRRMIEADEVAKWVRQEVADKRHVIVLGDFNELEYDPPLVELEGSGNLTNLIKRLPSSERGSSRGDGYGVEYDHVLVTPKLAEGAEIEIVAVNEDFWQHPKTATKFELVGTSDHEPVLVRLKVPSAQKVSSSKVP